MNSLSICPLLSQVFNYISPPVIVLSISQFLPRLNSAFVATGSGSPLGFSCSTLLISYLYLPYLSPGVFRLYRF